MLGMRLRKVATDDRSGCWPTISAILARRRYRGDRRHDRKHRRRPVADDRRRVRGGGTWLHVDAAYAGAAMVCPEFRWAFEGVDRADSLVVNAHKWMLTPMDCSLLWSRRPADLRSAFSLTPEYLRTPDAEDACRSASTGRRSGAVSGR